jgi:flagellar biosynthesis protein FlhF
MQTALAQVKRELGPEAVILNTKTFHQRGFLGFGKREIVEILASKEVNIVDTPPAFARKADAYARHHIRKQADLAPSAALATASGKSEEIIRELASLKSQVELLTREYVQDADYPPVLNEYYRSLQETGVSKLLAKKIVGAVHTELGKDELDDKAAVKNKLAAELGTLIKLSGPIQCDGEKTRKIVMTGPTGVGKTTTIAKLAANYSIKEKRDVGLITADTYRIAAVEQLKVYADIIGVTLEVVLTPKELREAVRRNADKDIVFIDTAGRSQRNQTRLVELKNFVEAAEPDENHLLISATTDTDEIFTIIDRFNIVDVTSFIFSKVDECAKPGVIFNVLANCEKPISYLTTGQDVPDDIEISTESGLLDLLFRDRENE